jgi:hypothetical protein
MQASLAVWESLAGEAQRPRVLIRLLGPKE